VLVHVDVGTAALGQGLHNASSGKVPMIIIAGEAPTTLSGVPGCRSEPVQWYQDVHGQGDLVRPYSRYTYSLAVHDDFQKVISRAKLMATTGVPGPVYLTASREVLAADTSRPTSTVHKPVIHHRAGELSDGYAKQLAQALAEATSPLVVTGYLGRQTCYWMDPMIHWILPSTILQHRRPQITLTSLLRVGNIDQTTCSLYSKTHDWYTRDGPSEHVGQKNASSS
jgi:thiamine pyrophosphate-dependent acetolactate synthase large subunit-like protein